jgi:hypothetical protein
MYEHLRTVVLDGIESRYTLTISDTHTTDWQGKSRLHYRFEDISDGVILFEGTDFCASPLHAVDSDDTIRALLGFLTLRPGDTDADYFAGYNDRQMAFAEGDAESLQLYTLDEDALPFNERA